MNIEKLISKLGFILFLTAFITGTALFIKSLDGKVDAFLAVFTVIGLMVYVFFGNDSE